MGERGGPLPPPPAPPRGEPVLLPVVPQVGVELQQAPGRHLLEQGGELVLPLVAVLHERELEVGTVQQHELDVEHRLLLLHVVGHLRVAARARVAGAVVPWQLSPLPCREFELWCPAPPPRTAVLLCSRAVPAPRPGAYHFPKPCPRDSRQSPWAGIRGFRDAQI